MIPLGSLLHGHYRINSTTIVLLDEDGHRVVPLGIVQIPNRKEPTTMADSLSMALSELLRKAEAEPDLDTLREGVRVLTQALMELEVAQHLGAERYQRSPDRQGERNGYRDRNWDTRVGTLELPGAPST